MTTARSSPVPFSGIPPRQPGGDVLSPELSPVRFPVGFDAVAQFDRQLLLVQLVRNLEAAGLAELSARVEVGTEVFPPEVQAALAPLLSPLESRFRTAFLELRLRDPLLATLGAAAEPPSAGGVVMPPDFQGAGGGPAAAASGTTTGHATSHVVVSWTLELNLLRPAPDGVLDGTTGAPPAANGTHAVGGNEGGVLSTGEPTRPRVTSAGSRVPLAGGRAVTRVPVQVVTRPELLQAWLELQVARTETVATTEDPPLAALLATPRGRDMLGSALADFIAGAGLRLSPRVAVAGRLAPQYVATLGLTAMRVAYAVRLRPDGSEVLSLCFSFGEDAGGSLAQLQTFLGASHFAYYVTLGTVAPVLRTRWRFQPAGRVFVSDIHVEMPMHEGSEETGEGTLRVRVQLDTALSDVGLMALQSEHGDVLRLACDEEVQLLRAWYADGSEVGELGDLGDPAKLPLVVNVAPFTAAVAGESRDNPFRTFLRYVIEPLALPFVERFEVRRVGGFASEALGAVVARWSLPSRLDEVRPSGSEGGVLAGGQ